MALFDYCLVIQKVYFLSFVYTLYAGRYVESLEILWFFFISSFGNFLLLNI